MGITQKEIAQNLGVSFITVNRALNGSGYVSEKLKKKIFEYAKSHEYVPHKASQVLVRNKQKRLAVFSSTIPMYFWEDVKKGVMVGAEQLSGFNFKVSYHAIPENDTESYLKTVHQEIDKGLDGAAIVNQQKYDMPLILSLLEENDIPYVTYNIGAPESMQLCYIGTNYSDGGSLAAGYIGSALSRSNESKVLIITQNEPATFSENAWTVNQERLKGFCHTMKECFHGVYYEIEEIKTPLEQGINDDELYKLLKKNENRVQAVYLIPALNSYFIDALKRTDYRNCITVLHDLGSNFLIYLEQRLLSAVVYQDPTLQGYYAVKVLEQIVDSGVKLKQKDIIIEHSLVLPENRNFSKNHEALLGIEDRFRS